MRQQGYTVMNYNAWEADYITDPIIGLIAEFKKTTTPKGKKTIEKMTKAAAKISFAMIPEILAQIAKYYTGVEWDKIVKEGSKESMKILNQCIENYEKQQKTIEDFKEHFLNLLLRCNRTSLSYTLLMNWTDAILRLL